MGKLVLTACDHEQNGFVAVAQWSNLSETEAWPVIHGVDAEISDEMEPDMQTAPFTFILDWVDENGDTDTGKRCLPTQIAMRLAPEHVQNWLSERPEPDIAYYRDTPEASRAALAAAPTSDGR